jgi:hypothetical protein
VYSCVCCYNCSTHSRIWNCAVSIVSCYWADLWTRVIAICFIWVILYIMHQNCMPTGPVVLHTGNFLRYCEGCGVLSVLYYKMVLKCTAREDIHLWSMEEALQLMKDEVLSMYKVSKQYPIWWNSLNGYTQKFLEHPNCKYCKAVRNVSIYCEVICRLWFNS